MRLFKFFLALVTIILLVSPSFRAAQEPADHVSVYPERQLLVYADTRYYAFQPVTMVERPKPVSELQRILPPFDLFNLTENATATFAINYIPAGGRDRSGRSCLQFPESAKIPFNAAAAIWGNLLQSSVPITINACWASLSGTTLGASGPGYIVRDFNGAPKRNTWYNAALANALSGTDLYSDEVDMHITYNSNYSWYYGTDGNPPLTQIDLMSVVLHEIGHGLNFMGTASYSGGIGNLGVSGFFAIYDTFVVDGFGGPLTNYPNTSTSLGDVLTGGNLWFAGPYAMAANSGLRVKLYAPPTWASGSSYSHLDYDTFNNTANQLMIYAISKGEAIHDPGSVTLGIFKDLGWKESTTPPPPPPPPPLTPSVFGDMNGDGKADILWHHKVTGQVQLYLMSGATIQSSTLVTTVADPAWEIIGRGDYNGDRKADILWKHKYSGDLYVYLMNGATIQAAGLVNRIEDDRWEVVGSGDYNGDGKADILWRHKTSGDIYLYLMNGAAILSAMRVGTVADPAWVIVGSGDYNGDGKADLLWRYEPTGEVYLYLMNGPVIMSATRVASVADPAWEIVGTGDYNGDGKADMLWRYKYTGDVYLYLMNGATILSATPAAAVADPAWEIVGTNDYNGDGKADILWRYKYTGQVYLYLMNGASVTWAGNIATMGDLNWAIVRAP